MNDKLKSGAKVGFIGSVFSDFASAHAGKQRSAQSRVYSAMWAEPHHGRTFEDYSNLVNQLSLLCKRAQGKAGQPLEFIEYQIDTKPDLVIHDAETGSVQFLQFKRLSDPAHKEAVSHQIEELGKDRALALQFLTSIGVVNSDGELTESFGG